MNRREVYHAVKEQLLDYLRQGSIYDSDDPSVIALACEEPGRSEATMRRAPAEIIEGLRRYHW